MEWRLIVPVKGAPDAKSRLRVDPGVARIDVARAMALDTIEAALASPAVASVLVVSSDPQVAAMVTGAGARVEPDPGTGLNDAVRRGRDRLAAESDARVAVLLADLPALRAPDLTAALEVCSRYDAAYVPDAEGTGTVLLTAARPDLLQPAFGADSAHRHHEVAHRTELDLPRLRRDVDLAVSLSSAQALGLGPRTEAVLARGARAAGR